MGDAADEIRGYERVGRLLYGLQRLCGGVEELRGLNIDMGVPHDTAERGAALADRYDILLARLTRNSDEVGSSEVDAFLADARVLAEEVAGQCGRGWRYGRR